MTAKQRRRRELLEWSFTQYADISASELAESLSCENLRWDEGIPLHLTKAVTEFRHLRTDRRIAACRAFIGARK